MTRALAFFLAAGLMGAPAAAEEASLLGGLADTARLSRALAEASTAWENVRDYESRFVKQEKNSEGKTGPEETIFLKFEKPFKIFLRWQNTHKKGLQVFYERGKHGNKLGVHQPGLLLGLASVVFLSQDSPWVREGSASFDIEDAGIGTFLESLAEDAIAAEKQNRLNVRTVKEDAQGLSMEIEFKDSKKEESFMARRVDVFFDALTRLPTRMTLFDEAGALIGRYAYEDLKLNAGPAGSAFQKQAHRKLFRLYTGDRG